MDKNKNTRPQPVMVTESFLPPREEYLRYLDSIFASHSLTNQGHCVQTLEQKLRVFLDVANLNLCANGTLALQLALHMLSLQGKKVITTPFTYVATLSALLWENCVPVFADIDPGTLCLSPLALKKCLEQHPDVAGILPVHVFGNACDVRAIGELADEHGLKVLYDGAHAFGSTLDGKSLLSYGDAAICSFHATKLFHTVEGGCVVTPDSMAAMQFRLQRAFGHIGDEHVCPGINAKLSELHAAMGLANLPHVKKVIAQRRRLTGLYDETLSPVLDGQLRRPQLAPDLVWNHAYYPVIFDSPEMMATVLAALRRHDIYPRRYFYPSLTRLPYIAAQSCPISEQVSESILCLPLWPGMGEELVQKISFLIMDALN